VPSLHLISERTRVRMAPTGHPEGPVALALEGPGGSAVLTGTALELEAILTRALRLVRAGIVQPEEQHPIPARPVAEVLPTEAQRRQAVAGGLPAGPLPPGALS
jgi:hypothetical protein